MKATLSVNGWQRRWTVSGYANELFDRRIFAARVKISWLLSIQKQVVMFCFVAFMLCNMDRVNMSIAILPMAQEFGWSNATQGLIQSSFFWGYLLTQVLGKKSEGRVTIKNHYNN